MPTKEWEKRLQAIEASSPQAVGSAHSLEDLDAVRVRLLGRKGELTELLKTLKDIPLDERKRLGPAANSLKERLEALLAQREGSLKTARIQAAVAQERLDPTLPGAPATKPHVHPITRTMREMIGILSHLGFEMKNGPLVETDFYNFQALNMPPEHPARDMQDTFYLEGTRLARDAGKGDALLLRTHTSPVQVRVMEGAKPPIRILCPGRVFRHENVDAGHSAVFHQVEGLYIDKKVSMADLKGTLKLFLQGLFGSETQMRFRPSYFPFVEPGAEVDVSCVLCLGKGCSVCKQSGWLELLGAGLVHPHVLKSAGIDPEQWSGFAFGFGVERVAMLKYGIDDIRLLYENDVRFLQQF